MKESKEDNFVKTGKVIVYVHDVTDGNPNGDPKLNNMPRPRVDGKIWVSGESLKYKVRRRMESFGHPMFISKGVSLNNRIADLPKGEEDRTEALLDTYLDARVFGAVANTGGLGAGVVHGAVQIHDSVSINVPVVELAQLIRCVQTKKDENHTMGNRYKVQYAAMRGTLQISPNRAHRSKMTEKDEKVFIASFMTMFHDHASNSSGIQRMRKAFLFESDSPSIDVGIAIDAIKTSVKEGVDIVTSFDDIKVELLEDKIPKGVKVTELM